MNRAHMNHEEREAMRILDMARAGMEVADEMVIWALFVSGDLVGVA